MDVSRRQAFKIAGVGAATAAAGVSVGGCAGAVAGSSFLAEGSWLWNLSHALGAGLIVEHTKEWVNDSKSFISAQWNEWYDGARVAAETQANEGFSRISRQVFGDLIPPAAMFSCMTGKQADPTSDRLVVVVNGGADTVVFDPWAWLALGKFATDMTTDRKGDDLSYYRRLIGMSLTPSGVAPQGASSPSGNSRLLSYKARNGSVEMTQYTDSSGRLWVQVRVFGMPTEKGDSTVRSYPLT